jgi:hypothetical protein
MAFEEDKVREVNLNRFTAHISQKMPNRARTRDLVNSIPGGAHTVKTSFVNLLTVVNISRCRKTAEQSDQTN